MFKVTEQFDLNKLWDILPQDQRGQEGRRLGIVGKEEDDEKDTEFSLLLCVQANGKTFLDTFTPKTSEVAQLASWDEKMDIVWATVNPARSFVAVSYEQVAIVEKRQGSIAIHVPERSYDSFVQTISNNEKPAKRYGIYHPTQTPQRVDFVSEEAKNPRVSTVSLLVTVFNEAITSYTMTLERKHSRDAQDSPAEYAITKAPKRDIVVSNQFIWAQYVPRTGTLYSISTKQQKGKGRPLHEFRSVPMRAKKPLKGATESVIPALFNMSSYFSLNPVYGTYPLPHLVGAAENMMVTSPLPNVSVVRLSPAVTCICVQFEFVTSKDGAVSIPVSIIPLTAHARIDFAIPLPGRRDEGFDEGTRVAFDGCNDFLVAYIPGVYAQLFDFSELHDPLLGPAAEGPAHATRLGGTSAVAPLGGSMLLGIDSSTIYKYELSRDFLIEVCAASPDPRARAMALHASCVHLKDIECTKSVLRTVLSKGAADVEFLKEAIVAVTFINLQGVLPHPILLGCPSTVLPYSSLNDTLKEIKNVESLTLMSTDSAEKERGEQQRSYWRVVDPLAMAAPPLGPASQPSGILQVISSKKYQAHEDEVISFYIQEQYDSIETITNNALQCGKTFSDLQGATNIEEFMKIMRDGGQYRNRSAPIEVIASPSISINVEEDDSQETGRGDGGVIEFDYYDRELDEWLVLDNEGKQTKAPRGDDSSSSSSSGGIVPFLNRVTTDGESMTKAISSFKGAILGFYPRLKMDVAEKCAIAYAIFQDSVVQMLFRDIMELFDGKEAVDDEKKDTTTTMTTKKRTRREEAALFHFLENFLGALIELGRISVPQSFDPIFSQLGCKFLPRQMFLQYVNRGLIKVTEDFVLGLQAKKTYEKDPEFFFSCLARLPISTATRLLLEAPYPPQKFFLEYVFSNNYPCLLLQVKSMTLDADCEYSRFIPLSLFIKSLEKQIEITRSNYPGNLDPTLCQVMKNLSFDDFYSFISPK